MKQTNHELVCEFNKTASEEGPPKETYQFIQCAGCDSGSMIHITEGAYIDSEIFMEELVTAEYHPQPLFRRLPNWIERLTDQKIGGERGSDFADVLVEIYTVAGRQKRLAAMGIRALFDQMLVDKVGDVGNFKQKMKLFELNKYVSQAQLKSLKAVLDAGHAASHRFYEPSSDDIRTSLDVIESLILDLYIHPHSTEQLASRTPPDPRWQAHPKETPGNENKP